MPSYRRSSPCKSSTSYKQTNKVGRLTRRSEFHTPCPGLSLCQYTPAGHRNLLLQSRYTQVVIRPHKWTYPVACYSNVCTCCILLWGPTSGSSSDQSIRLHFLHFRCQSITNLCFPNPLLCIRILVRARLSLSQSNLFRSHLLMGKDLSNGEERCCIYPGSDYTHHELPIFTDSRLIGLKGRYSKCRFPPTTQTPRESIQWSVLLLLFLTIWAAVRTNFSPMMTPVRVSVGFTNSWCTKSGSIVGSLVCTWTT